MEFVMFVQYPQWNFLSYWIWAMFHDLMNFLNMPSQDTLIYVPWAGYKNKLHSKFECQTGIKLVHLQCKTFIQNRCCYYSKILIKPGDNIEKAFKGWHKIYVEPRKTRAKKKYENSDQGFSKMAVSETQMENLHVPATLKLMHVTVYLVKT